MGNTYGSLRFELFPKDYGGEIRCSSSKKKGWICHCTLLQAVYLHCLVVDVFPHGSHIFSITSEIFLKPVLCPHLYSISFRGKMLGISCYSNKVKTKPPNKHF